MPIAKKALHTLAFPSFVAWDAPMLVRVLLLEKPLCSSHTFAHTVLFRGILSPLLLVLKSYPFFRDQSNITTFTKSCLNPPKADVIAACDKSQYHFLSRALPCLTVILY